MKDELAMFLGLIGFIIFVYLGWKLLLVAVRQLGRAIRDQ